ncbi:MAG: DNA-binding protein WhiA [Bacillota bacterium]
MSFSHLTKNELARIPAGSPCCQRAELAALARLDGTLKIARQQVTLQLVNQNAAVARRIFALLKELFDVQPRVLVQRKTRLRKNNIYLVVVSPGQAGPVLEALGLLTPDGMLQQKVPPSILRRDCCRRAYLRGAFMGGGSVNNPGGTYHLEIISNNEQHAKTLAALMKRCGLDAKVSTRKSWFVVYLKESEQIAACLSIMGAHAALLEFENKRVMKDMRNHVNRLVNCETANLNKTVQAAVKQVEDIKLIESTIGLDELPEPLRQTARLRLNHPDASLRELAEMSQPRLGRSGINHRLRKIEQIARQLRQDTSG